MSVQNLREKDTIPITERPNELTFDIDAATASDITKILHQCDSQIFSGWKHFPGIYDKKAITAMDRIAEKAAEMLQDSNGDTAIVFSGCGTSGRLAFFLARKFSHLAKAQQLSACYEYLIAGGDLALFTSQEAPEDNWQKGQEDLIEVSRNKKRVLFIGITCGLSAPYVAGQLDYCIRHPDIFTPVLLGFNPVNQARQIRIEGWDKSFLDVANKLEELDEIILNPVIGPEAVTGSSRMKGGSATKIVLESTLLKAHATLYWPTFYKLPQILMMYENMFRGTYLGCCNIARAVELAAESLRCNGHVYYIGWGSLGYMGLLDASECVPTFSANFNDVRGFLQGGYQTLNNKEGELFLNGSNKLYISLQDFQTVFLPELALHDTVIFICPDCKEIQEVMAITKLIEEKGAQLIGIIPENEVQLGALFNKCFVPVKSSTGHEDLFEEFQPRSTLFTDVLKECFLEISVKWILNAISTGAHVLKGKVLKNVMIDVKVSNNKLFHRAVSTVSTFARVDHARALHAILQAIYRKDIISDVVDRQVSEHVINGSMMDHVVPVAVLVATGKFSIDSAMEILKTKTVSCVIRNLDLMC